jgi:tetratricopeptide (TPR) repeat protein
MNTSTAIKFRILLFFMMLVSFSPVFSQDAAKYLKAGDSLYYLREYDSSITRYEEALELDPASSTALYNAACVYSLLGKPDSAFAKLEAVTAYGYDNLNWISSDTDLENIRGDKRWEGLITKIKQNLDKRRDPGNMKVVTSDINNFWEMYDKYKATGSINDIEKYYFSRQSEGLKAITRIREVNPSAMEKVLKHFPKYLESIRANTLKLSTAEEKLKKHFLKLKELYPDVIFPDIYFVMGCFNTGGTVLDRMLLIGSEMQCADRNTNKGELTTWLKGNIGDFKNIEFIVMHESIHTLQLTRASRLLDAVILEGSCDFIASLVTGKKINTPHYVYGAENEQELWEELKKDKDDLSYVNWLYQGDKSKERPADLGYFMGYRICEEYYNNAGDKKQAIKDIIEVKNFEDFLKKSGYEKKFE